jgi:hypothetical protein
MIEVCFKIKNDLVKYSKDRPIDEAAEPHVLELINNINEFSHSFKKRKVKKPEKPVTIEEPIVQKPHKNPFDIPIDDNGQPKKNANSSQHKMLELSRSLEFDIEEFNREAGNADNWDGGLLEPCSPPRMSGVNQLPVNFPSSPR